MITNSRFPISATESMLDSIVPGWGWGVRGAGED